MVLQPEAGGDELRIDQRHLLSNPPSFFVPLQALSTLPAPSLHDPGLVASPGQQLVGRSAVPQLVEDRRAQYFQPQAVARPLEPCRPGGVRQREQTHSRLPACLQLAHHRPEPEELRVVDHDALVVLAGLRRGPPSKAWSTRLHFRRGAGPPGRGGTTSAAVMPSVSEGRR